MRKERKHYTPEEKGSILRRHLINKVPVSTLCEEVPVAAHGLLPLAGAVVCIALFTLVAGALVGAQEPSQTSTGEVHEIKMTARKYRFDPNEITVKKGEHVRLVINALDRDHGFKLDAFNINQKLKKGEPATIEFIADKTGTFPFKCSDFCGLGHRKMKGRLVVEEP